MDVVAWSNVSAWWSTHFPQNAMKNNGEFLLRHDQLSNHYRTQFAAASPDSDLRF